MLKNTIFSSYLILIKEESIVDFVCFSVVVFQVSSPLPPTLRCGRLLQQTEHSVDVTVIGGVLVLSDGVAVLHGYGVN